MKPNLRIDQISDHLPSGSEDHFRKVIVGNLREGGSSWPPVDEEGLWAINLGGGLYRVDNIPFFAKDLSLGDIVKAADSQGRLIISNVLDRGGHST
jgi:hypothetical protein